MRTLGAVGEWS